MERGYRIMILNSFFGRTPPCFISLKTTFSILFAGDNG